VRVQVGVRSEVTEEVTGRDELGKMKKINRMQEDMRCKRGYTRFVCFSDSDSRLRDFCATTAINFRVETRMCGMLHEARVCAWFYYKLVDVALASLVLGCGCT
jgi:hypothetical protein